MSGERVRANAMPRPVVSDHNRQDWASPNFIEGNQDRDLRCLHRYSTPTIISASIYILTHYTRQEQSNTDRPLRYLISKKNEKRKKQKEGKEGCRLYNHHVTAAHITYAPNLHHQLGLGLGHITVCFSFSCSAPWPFSQPGSGGASLASLAQSWVRVLELLLPGCGSAFPSRTALQTLGDYVVPGYYVAGAIPTITISTLLTQSKLEGFGHWARGY